VRRVRTASGAVAVQVVRKHRGQRTILAHVGSAHTDAQLGILLERARRIAAEDQGVLDIEVAARTQRVDGIADWRAGELIPATSRPNGAPVPPGRTAATHSRLLYDVLGSVYDWLGFNTVDDGVFRDLVIARIVEPTSKADAARVLADLGADTVSYRTIQRHLAKVDTGGYRDAIAKRCFTHAADRGGLSLLLYDVTTLYFEAENEDDLRKVGYSNYADLRIMPMWPQECLLMKRFTPRNVGIIWVLVRTLDCPPTQQRRPATPATRTRRRLGHGTVPRTNWPSAQPSDYAASPYAGTAARQCPSIGEKKVTPTYCDTPPPCGSWKPASTPA
jgi:hypothetical protein